MPKEAAVTKLSHTVPLDKGAAAWAKAALENASGPAERGGYSELVKNAGFECAEVSKMIENTYLGI